MGVKLGVLAALLWAFGIAHGEETLVDTARTASGETVPYILDAVGDSPRYVVILFPGGNGIVNPRIEEGRLAYEKRGNFLVRTRAFLVDPQFASVTTDSTQSRERVQALIDDIKRRFPGAQIYLMGTSRGTYDTLALADYLSDKIAGEIHTSSLAQIANFDPRRLANRQLIVHHRQDNCRVTPFAAAERSHERFATELIAMEGGSSQGPACEAFAFHGYNGIEKETIEAIKRWISAAPAAPAAPATN